MNKADIFQTSPARLSGRERLTGAPLREAWENLECPARKMRMHDSAAKLFVSEGELIASFVGTRAIRLKTAGVSILDEVRTLGPVGIATRNSGCVHAKTGTFSPLTGTGRVKLVLGGAIDLRLFPSHWVHSFAVFEHTDMGLRRSLQFFDADGACIFRIYQTKDTDAEAFEDLIAQWRSPDQEPVMDISPLPAPPPDRADSEIDITGLRAAWTHLQDTHDFFPMLQKFRVGRRQALRLGDPAYVRPAGPDAAGHLLEMARDIACPIMVFAGNPGCIQIHTGAVENISRAGTWLNVLDPGFCLHLQEDEIRHAYVVRKPTRDGDVHSVELFDRRNSCFVQFFGARKPGQPERDDWRSILSAL